MTFAELDAHNLDKSVPWEEAVKSWYQPNSLPTTLLFLIQV